NKKIEADGDLVKKLTLKLSGILTEKKDSLNISGDPVYLSPRDFYNLKISFNDKTLASSLIDLDESTVTLKDFINQLAFEGFNSEKTDAESIFILLNRRVRKFIEEELLAEEGYRRELDKLPGVQSQLGIWKENYLYQLMQSKYLDSVKVSEEEVFDYYSERHKKENYPLLVNVIEILTDSLSAIEEILNEIERGKDIR